jgi:hypothetical protein
MPTNLPNRQRDNTPSIPRGLAIAIIGVAVIVVLLLIDRYL